MSVCYVVECLDQFEDVMQWKPHLDLETAGTKPGRLIYEDDHQSPELSADEAAVDMKCLLTIW